MTIILNYLDNEMVFYSLYVGVVGAIGYSFTKKILKKSYMETGVQTDAGKILSDKSSQINPENVPLIDTFKDTSSLIPSTSEVGTQTTQTIAEDVTPLSINIYPDPDSPARVIDISNAEYLAAKVEQLNALDPFLATPWTPERISTMIDTLGVVNNIFN